MLDVLVLFPRSADVDATDQLVAELVPLLKESSGLRSLRVSKGDLMARGGPAPYSRVLEASFDSLADWVGRVEVLNSRQDLAAFERLVPVVVFFEVREP